MRSGVWCRVCESGVRRGLQREGREWRKMAVLEPGDGFSARYACPLGQSPLRYWLLSANPSSPTSDSVAIPLLLRPPGSRAASSNQLAKTKQSR